MGGHGLGEGAPEQQDDLGDGQLGDTARIGEGGIEDWDAPRLRYGQIDLIGTDGEAAHGHELVRALEDV